MQDKQWVTAAEGAEMFGYNHIRSFINYCAGRKIPRKPTSNNCKHFLYDARKVREAKQQDLITPTPKKSQWHGALSESEQGLIDASKDALIKQLVNERSRTRAIVEACEQAILKMPAPTVRIPSVQNLQGTKEELHLLLSDVQVGQFVDPKTVGGLASYSFEKFCLRLERLKEKILLFHDLFSRKRMIPKLVIHWLGDIVEGESIYLSQPFYIDRIVVDQVFDAVSQFIGFLLSLSKSFPAVENMMIWGNHGRVGSKADPRHVRDNWDYVFYRALRLALREQKNLKFFISESPFMVVQHGKYNFFLTHGDQVRSWMSIPHYGLDRMARKLTGLTGVQINYLQIGHHHRDATSSIPRGRWMVNGSFVGGSLLSVDALQEADWPKQILYMFHEEEGIHSISDLRLDEDMVLTPRVGDQGIYTPFLEATV